MRTGSRPQARRAVLSKASPAAPSPTRRTLRRGASAVTAVSAARLAGRVFLSTPPSSLSLPSVFIAVHGTDENALNLDRVRRLDYQGFIARVARRQIDGVADAAEPL